MVDKQTSRTENVKAKIKRKNEQTEIVWRKRAWSCCDWMSRDAMKSWSTSNYKKITMCTWGRWGAIWRIGLLSSHSLTLNKLFSIFSISVVVVVVVVMYSAQIVHNVVSARCKLYNHLPWLPVKKDTIMHRILLPLSSRISKSKQGTQRKQKYESKHKSRQTDKTTTTAEKEEKIKTEPNHTKIYMLNASSSETSVFDPVLTEKKKLCIIFSPYHMFGGSKSLTLLWICRTKVERKWDRNSSLNKSVCICDV